MNEGTSYKLVITNAQMDDADKYSIVLPGDKPQKSEGKLTVEELPLEFTKELASQEVEEKETAVFTCELSKPDQPVKWFFKGKQVKPSDKFIIENVGCVYTLTIKDCTLDDNADVKITTKDGKSAADLTVNGKILS